MEEKLGLKGLKLIRKQRKINQLKVATDLNISREALSHYENGKRSPDIAMLQKLSEYFNVSIDFLVNGKEFQAKWWYNNTVAILRYRVFILLNWDLASS